MTPLGASSTRPKAVFLSPEAPEPGTGGGGLRSASLLEFLRQRYSVDVFGFALRPHFKNFFARASRNLGRVLRGAPALFDRYSGYEGQISDKLHNRRYDLAVVEHFWCASYAPLLRSRCQRLVLDLHNIESELSRTHAASVGWPKSWMLQRFADDYVRLEKKWLPQFDMVLVASGDDLTRIEHPRAFVFPNALPELAPPRVAEEHCIAFSGNLEYHPNVEAVRWFRARIWPLLKDVEWRLIGRNPEAVERYAGPRISMTGPVDDAVTELARAKVCIVPLLSGSGTRFKILEAWAAERAVVSTTIGAEGLGAQSGEHLLIADTPEDFAAAISRLLADPDLRARLGAAGRARYLECFTWPAAWRQAAVAFDSLDESD